MLACQQLESLHPTIKTAASEGSIGKGLKKEKGADPFPFAFTGSLRMKTRHSYRIGCPHRIGMNIN